MNRTNSLWVYGIATGAVVTITAIAIYLDDLEFMPWMHFIVCIPIIAGVILYGFIFSKANNGYVTFRQVFEHCFYMAMIAAGVLMLWQLVSLAVVPDRMGKFIADNPNINRFHNRMAYKGNYTEARIEQSTRFLSIYIYAIALFKQLFHTLLAGTLFSIITAAIVDTHGARPSEDSMLV